MFIASKYRVTNRQSTQVNTAHVSLFDSTHLENDEEDDADDGDDGSGRVEVF